MNISNVSAINGLDRIDRYDRTWAVEDPDNNEGTGTGFEGMLNSAIKLIRQTEDYSNAAEEEEIKFATGETTNFHNLMIAQQKANISLQYTVAVKNTAMEAYRTLMNMQF